MTRKQMLNKLKLSLDNLELVSSNKLKADALLMEVEKYMLPPKVIKIKKWSIPFKNEQELFEAPQQVNEWEDE